MPLASDTTSLSVSLLAPAIIVVVAVVAAVVSVAPSVTIAGDGFGEDNDRALTAAPASHTAAAVLSAIVIASALGVMVAAVDWK